jgi:hypothetical protein
VAARLKKPGEREVDLNGRQLAWKVVEYERYERSGELESELACRE